MISPKGVGDPLACGSRVRRRRTISAAARPADPRAAQIAPLKWELCRYASPPGRCMTARSSKSGGSRSLYGQGINDESTFVPLSMLPKFRDIEDTSPNPIVEPTQQHWHMPNQTVKVARLNTADPYDRLHTSQIRTLKQQDITNGLVPRHILENTLPPAGPVIKSTDFFRPSKCDRAKSAPRSPTSANTPMTKALPVFTTTFKPSADGPSKASLRVVSHPLLGVALPKRNPDQNSHGISRNVLGGFYTS